MGFKVTPHRIVALATKLGAPGLSAVAVGGLRGVVEIERTLAEAGLRFRSVCEQPDASELVQKFRRWCVFVETTKLERAVGVLGRHSDCSVPLTPELCERHEFELEPCSRCTTGADWMAKAEELERWVPPARPTSEDPLRRVVLG